MEHLNENNTKNDSPDVCSTLKHKRENTSFDLMCLFAIPRILVEAQQQAKYGPLSQYSNGP